MPWQVWNQASPLPGPVYLDTNVFVAALVHRHRLYNAAALFVGEAMARRLQLVFSDLTMQEAHWALAAEASR